MYSKKEVAAHMGLEQMIKTVELWSPNAPRGKEEIKGSGDRPIRRLLEEFFRSDEDGFCFITTEGGMVFKFKRTSGYIEVSLESGQ